MRDERNFTILAATTNDGPHETLNLLDTVRGSVRGGIRRTNGVPLPAAPWLLAAGALAGRK
jgi:hypothetical protein